MQIKRDSKLKQAISERINMLRQTEKLWWQKLPELFDAIEVCYWETAREIAEDTENQAGREQEE